MRVDNAGTNIRLVVAGVECADWDDVSIDSQIDVPADAWSLSLFNPNAGNLQASIKGGARCELYYGNELVLTGIIDQLTEGATRAGRVINIAGRDMAGQLIDCSANILNATSLNFEQFLTSNEIAKYFPFAEMPIDIDVDKSTLNKNKVSIEPSESIWDALVKIASTAGQWVWFTADGALRIGDPFANPYQVKTSIKLMRSGVDNNALLLEYSEDVAGVFNNIKVLSQDEKANQLQAESISASSPYTFPRLKIITLDVENQAEAQGVLDKIKHDNDLEAYSLTATVAGWIVDGKCWQAGWEVAVQSDVLTRANAKWVVMGRTFKLSRGDGKTTVLKLKRRGDWAQPLVYKEPAR